MPNPFRSSPLPAESAAGFISHNESSFRRAFNLFNFPHPQLSHRARSSVEWAFLAFTDHSAHRPADWPHAAEGLDDPIDTMTAVEYLDELTALLTRLINESTDLATTLRYHRARAELLTAGDVGHATANPGPDDATASQPGLS